MEWRVVERLVMNRNRDLTLVDLFPHMSQVHQLRRHCQKIGHPILGNLKYGFERDDSTLSAEWTTNHTEPLSLMLVAVHLKLSHPDAHFKARSMRTDPDALSGSWTFAAADQS